MGRLINGGYSSAPRKAYRPAESFVEAERRYHWAAENCYGSAYWQHAESDFMRWARPTVRPIDWSALDQY